MAELLPNIFYFLHLWKQYLFLLFSVTNNRVPWVDRNKQVFPKRVLSISTHNPHSHPGAAWTLSPAHIPRTTSPQHRVPTDSVHLTSVPTHSVPSANIPTHSIPAATIPTHSVPAISVTASVPTVSRTTSVPRAPYHHSANLQSPTVGLPAVRVNVVLGLME